LPDLPDLPADQRTSAVQYNGEDLCSVSPSGISTRISYGVVNIDRHATDTEASSSSSRTTVSISMENVAFNLPADHTLRLAISRSYWPVLATTSKSSPVGIMTGGQIACALTLTVTPADEASKAVLTTVDQEVILPEATATFNVRRGSGTSWDAHENGRGPEVTIVDDRGSRRLETESQLEVDTALQEHMNLADGTTSHRVEWRTQLFRPGHGDESKDWGADVVLSSEQTITPSGDVKLITRLNALERVNDHDEPKCVASREWSEEGVFGT
jgi:hypothetical protein